MDAKKGNNKDMLFPYGSQTAEVRPFLNIAKQLLILKKSDEE